MAEILNQNNSNFYITHQINPDTRFATTFISNKYRDYAVKGETIMDKETGEIFTRRPSDGRVVSFFQNKKYMHDLMLTLRVLLNNNMSFKYPSEEDMGAYYVSTDYDLMSINDNKINDIIENDTVISYGKNDFNKLCFNISAKTNGFFCRLTSRDCDKAIIEWITTSYNKFFKDYNGTKPEYIEEQKKIQTIEKWVDSNAVIKYDIIVTGLSSGNTNAYGEYTDYVRINEDTCVLFPLSSTILEDFDENVKITIRINSITYPKLHFFIEEAENLGDSIVDEMYRFMNADGHIFMQYCNIGSFIDSSKDIELLGNEFIVALMDVPYVHRYMMKMSKLIDDGNVIFSPNRPESEVWRTNGLWAEQIRNVYNNGEEVEQFSEGDIRALERYIANNNTRFVSIDRDEFSENNLFITGVN